MDLFGITYSGTYDFFWIFDHKPRIASRQLFPCPESPCDSNGPDAGIAAGEHVDIGISAINDLIKTYARNGTHYLRDDFRVRLDGLALPLSQYAAEPIPAEELRDKRFRSFLILV